MTHELNRHTEQNWQYDQALSISPPVSDPVGPPLAPLGEEGSAGHSACPLHRSTASNCVGNLGENPQ